MPLNYIGSPFDATQGRRKGEKGSLGSSDLFDDKFYTFPTSCVRDEIIAN